MGRANIPWLLEELARWENTGLIDGATAARLRQQYPPPAASGRSLAMTAFAVLGALMVGAGLLLLLAYNWAVIPRAGRVGLALLPLLAAQAMGWFGLQRGKESVGWREGLGLFWFLAVGGSVAMVGQLYHLPAAYDRFLLTWALLTLPVIWLLQSSVAAIFYLAAATAWSIDRMDYGYQELWYWALLVALLPIYIANVRRGRAGAAPSLLWWATVLALGIGTALTMARAVPGLWMIVFSSWSSIFLLLDQRRFQAARSLWQRPFLVVGALGALGLILSLTFDTPWRQIGWHHLRSHVEPWRQTLDLVLTLGLAGAAVGLLVAERSRMRPSRLALTALPLLTIATYSYSAQTGGNFWPMLIFNLYAFGVGLLLLVDGFRQTRGRYVNAGMLMLGALVMARFFDSEQGILVRGLAFMALGGCFLATNVALARRRRRAP